MKRRGARAKKLISIIIPAYRAEKVIEKSLLEIKDILDDLGQLYEIICVVDGQEDRTYELAGRLAKKFPRRIKVIGYLTNLGKGHAVRFGMAKAKGQIIGFVDVGLDLNPSGISMLLEHFRWYNADIIVGSKRHPASKVSYRWQRRIMSFGYQILVKTLFGLKVKDTQIGMKVFRREVLEKVLPRLLVKAFAFDIEILAVAHHLGFRAIYEAPIEYKVELKASSIATKGFIKTALRMLRDTLAVFYRLKVLNYYHNKNRKNWLTPQYLTFENKRKND